MCPKAGRPNVQERLAKALADINVIEENERSAVSNKDYSAAAQLKEEGDNARASLAADIKAANEKLVGTPTEMVAEVEESVDPTQDHVLNYKLY